MCPAAISTEQSSSLGLGEEPESNSRFQKLASAVGRVPLIALDDLDIGKVLGVYPCSAACKWQRPPRLLQQINHKCSSMLYTLCLASTPTTRDRLNTSCGSVSEFRWTVPLCLHASSAVRQRGVSRTRQRQLPSRLAHCMP